MQQYTYIDVIFLGTLFSFVDNEHLPDGEYIALIRGNMDSRNTIEYKKIEDNVLVIRKEG